MWVVELAKFLGATNTTAIIGGGMGIIFFMIIKGFVLTKGDTKLEVGKGKNDK